MSTSEALDRRKDHLARADGFAAGATLDGTAGRPGVAAEATSQRDPACRPAAVPGSVELTERETEMLALLGEGKTNREIAARCWISKNTVKFHLKNLFRKLAVHNRGHAMLIARTASHREPDIIWPPLPPARVGAVPTSPRGAARRGR